MAGLTQNQWIVIGVIVAILILGSFGYYFTTRGELGPKGMEFMTGFGVGGPSITGADGDDEY